MQCYKVCQHPFPIIPSPSCSVTTQNGKMSRFNSSLYYTNIPVHTHTTLYSHNTHWKQDTRPKVLSCGILPPPTDVQYSQYDQKNSGQIGQ